MKRISFFLLVCLALASCSSDEFKIDGTLMELDGKTVRVVFHGDSALVDEDVEVDDKGHFTFKASSSQPVLINLMNWRGEPLVSLVATNGDHLKVKGGAGKAMGLKVSGNRLNEDWQLFRDEHAAFYADPNPSRLDAAIEKYVREHPDDMLSTVLLLADYSDYSDRGKMDKMLKSLKTEARPKSLLQPFQDNPAWRGKDLVPRLMTLNLIKHDGGDVEISLTKQKTLISLWANPQNSRNGLIGKLQALDKSVRVIDILAESDSLQWHKTISADPEHWQHYWAPGGPLEPGIQLLGITSLPWFAVTDSTGLVTYSGPDLSTAITTLTSKENNTPVK